MAKANNLPEVADTKIPLYMKHTSSGKIVCFNCRICFHKPRHGETNLPPCNNCQGPMHYAGSAFRSPPKRDKRTWAMLEVLIRGGVRFHYCGGVGKVPVNANDAKKVMRRGKTPTILARRKTNGKRVLVKDHQQWRDPKMNWSRTPLYVVEE